MQDLDPSRRESLILAYLPLVRRMANVLRSSIPPGMSYDDLASAGALGLIAAVDRHDPAKGDLVLYATVKIRSAMKDTIRQLTGRADTVNKKVWTHLTDELMSTLSANAQPPQRDVLALIAFAKAPLTPRHREVLRLYYFEDLSMAEIAAAMGVNESRISQIHKAALGKLRPRFSGAAWRLMPVAA